MEIPKTRRLGVDWLTVTARSRQAMDMLTVTAESLVRKEAALAGSVEALQWQGYHGTRAGAVSWGHRVDSVFCVVRGAASSALIDKLVPFCERVTRLDMQVTIELDTEQVDLAREMYESVSSREPRPRAFDGSSFIFGVNGGQTCYVGKRGKVSFARVYDKGVQSKTAPEGKVWRYEVQMKHPLATQVARSYIEARDRGTFISSYVHDWFEGKELLVCFEPEGSYNLIEREIKVSSNEITLAWLQNTVGPVIIRLLEEGLRSDVEQAIQYQLLPRDGERRSFNGNK